MSSFDNFSGNWIALAIENLINGQRISTVFRGFIRWIYWGFLADFRITGSRFPKWLNALFPSNNPSPIWKNSSLIGITGSWFQISIPWVGITVPRFGITVAQFGITVARFGITVARFRIIRYLIWNNHCLIWNTFARSGITNAWFQMSGDHAFFEFYPRKKAK